MAPTNSSPDDSIKNSIKYLLTVMKNTDMPKPNYHVIATECGISSANNAQKRLKKIVEEAGFVLSDGQVMLPDGEVVPKVAATPKTAKRAKKNGDTPTPKKRKLTAKEESSEDDGAAVKSEIEEEVVGEET